MGDAMVGSWGDPADVRPSSTKLGGGLKPEALTFNFKKQWNTFRLSFTCNLPPMNVVKTYQ